jgi:RND family efflux transporter MFP subunit
MKTSFLNPLAWVALGSVACLALGCRPVPSQVPVVARPAARVTLQTVEWTPYAGTEEVVGTVRAQRRTVVEAKVMGRIVSLESRLGHGVQTGDLLVQLEAPELSARRDQARVVLEQAARERDRFQGLVQQKTVSPQEFDVVESRWRVAKAGLAEAETLLGYTRVVAPFDAAVSRKLAEVGDLATPGRPLLELEVPGELRLEADVGEGLIERLQVQQSVSVRVGRDLVLTGKVAEIAPAADPVSRTFLVKVDMPNTAGVRSGQFGRLAVPLGASPILRVPTTAVLRRGQLEYVLVAVEGTARLRLVRTGRVLGDAVELISGMEPAERVVVGGVASVVDGQKLEVTP